MTLRYLLDTNIVSHAMHEPAGSVGSRITVAGIDSVAISVVTLGELLFGYARNPTPRLKERLDGFLSRIIVLPVDAQVAMRYAEVRTILQRCGQLIGQNDLWIAAHALALNVRLVTDNTGEFTRVEGLRIENWVRP